MYMCGNNKLIQLTVCVTDTRDPALSSIALSHNIIYTARIKIESKCISIYIQSCICVHDRILYKSLIAYIQYEGTHRAIILLFHRNYKLI